MRFRHPQCWVRLVVVTLLAGLAACGGGGGSSGGGSTPPPVLMTKHEAFRFLNQATYGATEADVQMAQPASLQLLRGNAVHPAFSNSNPCSFAALRSKVIVRVQPLAALTRTSRQSAKSAVPRR